MNRLSPSDMRQGRSLKTPVKPMHDQNLPNLAAVSTPEQIEKAFSAFEIILSQRRTELSEMKKANQSRLSQDTVHRVSVVHFSYNIFQRYT